MILPRKRVITIFFVLALTVQMGYYFDFIEYSDPPPVPVFDFRSFQLPPPSNTRTALNAFCNKTKPRPDVYVNCSHISMPAFEAINQLEVCIRWAIDAGVGIIKPSFVLNGNDATGDDIEYITSVDFLLDEAHLWKALEIDCPAVHVIEWSKLVEEKKENIIALDGDPFFPGKLYRKGSYYRYIQHRLNQIEIPKGTVVVMNEVESLCAWERARDPLPIQIAYKHLFRFSQPLITIANRILMNLPHTFFGIHIAKYEYENVDELLDLVLRSNSSAEPVVYLACNDAYSLSQFTQHTQLKNITTLHKWTTTNSVDAEWMTMTLTVDQMKVVDHIVLLKAQYIFGNTDNIDTFMLGLDRHFIQFGTLDYHDIDLQQKLLGSRIQLWDGNSW